MTTLFAIVLVHTAIGLVVTVVLLDDRKHCDDDDRLPVPGCILWGALWLPMLALGLLAVAIDWLATRRRS